MLLRGASGTGKSSLLHLIAGLMRPSSGEIHVDGRDLSSMNDADRALFRRQHLGVIFQKLNLLSHLTVAENIALVSRDAKAIASALARVKMGEMADVRASVLSGGEQQRVAVARVLAQSPDLILADEPTSSLDDENASFVIDALKAAAQGKTFLVVSHDDRLAREFKDIRSLQELG